MGIRLEISNKNTDPVDIKVYRSTTELDRANLPTPVGTITQTTDNPAIYIDNEVTQGDYYYYVFETIGPKDRDYSRNFKVQALETRGPGDSQLKLGNRQLGYYGNLTAASLITGAQLKTALAASLPSAVFSNFPWWHKFARKNKVIYVPSQVTAYQSSLTPAQIVTSGLLDGVELTIGNFRYLARLVTGWSDGSPKPDSIAMDVGVQLESLYGTTGYSGVECEWHDLIYPLGMFTPSEQKLPNIAQTTVTTLLGGVAGTLCADKSDDFFVLRGIAAEFRTSMTNVVFRNKTTTLPGNTGMYIVLELIEG